MQKLAFLFPLFLVACTSTPYFKTSNDFYKQEVTMELINGNKLTGVASVLFEEKVQAPDFIRFKAKGDTTLQRIPIKNIKGYYYKDDYYALKYVDLTSTGVFNLLFVKRLTKEDSRLQFYELHQLYKSNDTGEELYYYFLSLPTHSMYEAWNIYSKNLVPSFEIKMSDIVSDCPALAAKIKAKEKGYFLAQFNFSNSKKVEVFMKIIDEYNNCK